MLSLSKIVILRYLAKYQVSKTLGNVIETETQTIIFKNLIRMMAYVLKCLYIYCISMTLCHCSKIIKIDI